MVIAKNSNTGEKYVLTEEQEKVLNYMRESFDVLAKSLGAGEATMQAYLMNLASNNFLEEIIKSNDNKSIPELLELEKYTE